MEHGYNSNVEMKQIFKVNHKKPQIDFIAKIKPNAGMRFLSPLLP